MVSAPRFFHPHTRLSANKMSRWIVADDFDTEITYSGDWLGVRGLFNSSKAGVSVQNAISKSGHKLTSNGTLLFPFSGTDIAVFGVSSALSNSTAGGKATIQCFVDGKSIGGLNTFGVFPWTSYCNSTGLSDGQHQLTATITADSANPFWLDFIRYAPASSTTIAGKLLMIDSTDPAVEYTTSATWKPQSTANVTSTSATPALKLTFTGASLTWFSLSTDALSQATGETVIKDQYPFTSVNAQLDGQTTGIEFPALQGTDFSYNKILFEVDGPLSPGEHTFSLDYSPTSQSPEALTLDFFLIQVGAIDSTSSSALPLPAQSTVFVSATTPGPIGDVASVITSQGPTGVSFSQVPQPTIITKPANQGIRNDFSGNAVAFAMLAIALIRLMGW
ncbi:hypothetical protein D9619_009294 [Psilocybe cf. subviscida]|uniref:Uncharacterized protein n=1 Tax=Psilocybe cf. subviscida TaxID=2480587 RepID=A0A8H5BVU6_9AGAR|nr:hypothetical protein D9619_009294 [Psilocybe cf. subviscida]